MSTPSPSRPSRAEIGNVLILAGSQSLFTITTITVMTLASVIGLRLSASPGLATLPIALMMFATVLTTLPASLLMRRIGRRAGFILGATAGGALGSALMLASVARPSFPLFCAGMFLIGIYQSFGMYYRFAAADVTRLEFRSRSISFVMTGGVVAAVLGPINARAPLGLIPAIPFGESFLVTLLVSLLAAALLLQLRVPTIENRHEETAIRPLAAVARHRGFVPAVLASTVSFSLMVLYMTVTPLGMQAQGFGMVDITIVVQSQVLSMFIPAFFTGVLINRIGLLPILWAGVALMSLAMLIGAVSATLPLYVASRIAFGVGWNFVFVGSAVLLSTTHAPAERGKVQGVNDLTMFIVATVGSIAAAGLLQKLGWNMLHLVSLLPVGLVGASLLWLHKGRGAAATVTQA
ncbi:MFS transporter [Pusillimonas noertemannii]|uniref:MFS transporter n=1 Tax=Pusillimonas noertemannii TaxID=305977 RepID=UPI000685F1DA|nr:MFS transporter [Pusillimonas noertemannii]